MGTKANKSNKQKTDTTIVSNRRARHEFSIEETFEAGIVLQGWEVKSLRAGRANLNETYVLLKHGEAWLLGLHISPLKTASTHVKADPTRTRKLLLHMRELKKLLGQVRQKGFTLVPLKLYWNRGRAKCEIALVKGKKIHDKRATQKDRDWSRQKERMLRSKY